MDAISAKMVVKKPSSAQYMDFPIPAEQLLEGEPESKVSFTGQSPDRKLTHGVWHCTPCKFTWDYTWDEFVTIVDGEVIIEEEGGPRHTLQKGDCVYFPPGLKTTWTIPKYVKKCFAIRSPEPLEL